MPSSLLSYSKILRQNAYAAAARCSPRVKVVVVVVGKTHEHHVVVVQYNTHAIENTIDYLVPLYSVTMTYLILTIQSTIIIIIRANNNKLF